VCGVEVTVTVVGAAVHLAAIRRQAQPHSDKRNLTHPPTSSAISRSTSSTIGSQKVMLVGSPILDAAAAILGGFTRSTTHRESARWSDLSAGAPGLRGKSAR
jgi:hypothetical protein